MPAPPLTPQLHAQIVAGIRAGGYPRIVAEANGVPPELFERWLERGESKGSREPYRGFAREVRTAFAQARLRAETEVFSAEPKIWLQHGPGRESADRPGWTAAVRSTGAGATERDILLDPHVMALLRMMLELLEPFPDLRQRFADLYAAIEAKAA